MIQKTDEPYIYSTWVEVLMVSPKEPHKISKNSFFHDKAEEIKRF